MKYHHGWWESPVLYTLFTTNHYLQGHVEGMFSIEIFLVFNSHIVSAYC